MPCTILSHSRIDGRLNEMFCLSSITQSILFLCKFSVDRGHNDSCNWDQCKVLKCQIKKYYYNLTIEDSRVVRDKTNFSYKQRCKKEFWEHQFYLGLILYKCMLTFKGNNSNKFLVRLLSSYNAYPNPSMVWSLQIDFESANYS